MTLRLLGNPLSPFVRKCHVAAAEKGLAVETVNASPFAPDAELLAASPFRKIPALVDGDFTLADSTAIVTYFEALAPSPALWPAEAKARAKAVWFEEVADTVLVPAGGPLLLNRFLRPVVLRQPGNEDEAEAALVKLADVLTTLEGLAPVDGWFAGEFSIADIAMASALRSFAYARFELDAAAYPKLAAWLARVHARDSWIAVAAMETAINAKVMTRAEPA